MLTSNFNPINQAVLNQKIKLTADDAEDLLKQEGLNLWQDLIPLELRQRYDSERNQWRNKSLLIVSDEPAIPWELLWPYEDEDPLCLQMKMSRWLRRDQQGQATIELEPDPSLRALSVIAPVTSHLLGAQQERCALMGLMREHGLKDVSPSSLTRRAVKQLLQQGDYSWVHFAAHGNFYTSDPNGESAIWLEDWQPITPQAIVGQVQQYIRQHRPAFVLNACEVGRMGWSITGLGGWANQLLRAGAGLFLSPLWVVKDRTALEFSKTVYEQLLTGQTIAEAVRQGRLTARREGDPGWLAYSLYAHPNARVV